MGLDIRMPMGLMFSVLGLILVVYGAISDPKIYQEHSLGININLIWGSVILAFGLLMLLLSWLGSKQAQKANSDQATKPTTARQMQEK